MVQLPTLESEEMRRLEDALRRLARPGVFGSLRVELDVVPVTVEKLRLNLLEKVTEKPGLALYRGPVQGNFVFPQDDRGKAAAQFLKDFNRKSEDHKLRALVAYFQDGVILTTETERAE